MSFKIPCGGFKLDEKSFSLDENGVLSVSGGASSGAITTLHIDISAINAETMEASFTADKTPAEMYHASLNGPIWCVVTFAAGTMENKEWSIGLPPAWCGNDVAFGMAVRITHDQDGSNKISYLVAREDSEIWRLDLGAFGH